MDNELRNLGEPIAWPKVRFVSRNIGTVLKQSNTQVIERGSFTAHVDSHKQLEAQLGARLVVKRKALEDDQDRRVRQKTNDYRGVAEEQRRVAEEALARLDAAHRERATECELWEAEKQCTSAQLAKLQQDAVSAARRVQDLEVHVESLQAENRRLQGYDLDKCTLEELGQLQKVRLSALSAHESEMSKRVLPATCSESSRGHQFAVFKLQ